MGQVTMSRAATGTVLAISDLHVAHAENRQIVEALRPQSDADWLIVAGDVGEVAADIEWALALLRSRFSTVIWVPGNHELWTPRTDPVQVSGDHRYRYLVAMCRRLGVLTPEDPYPVWEGTGGPMTVAPLFLLYDYTFRPAGARNKQEGLALARTAGVLCADEALLQPDPYPDIDTWSRCRVAHTRARLAACDPALPTVLVNHFPLVRDPTYILRHPEFAQWCGTESTADWHLRFRAAAVVYGHLHIPRTTWYDGVRFEEVSVGYPREWRRWAGPRHVPRQILPEPDHHPAAWTAPNRRASGPGPAGPA
jgi:3',5'-cyclic AMP phosphodiesterase CpdA